MSYLPLRKEEQGPIQQKIVKKLKKNQLVKKFSYNFIELNF